MKFKKVISIVLTLMLIVTAVAIPVNASAVTNKYADAANALDAQAYTGDDLGAIYSPESTTFKVWSPTATAVVLNLYATGSDTEEGAADLGNYDMTMDDASNGVWSVTVQGDLKNVYYTYTITAAGKTNETGDIYARAAGVNGNRSMVVDLDSTDPEGWENDTYQLVANQTDANIWEIHVKDFSYDESSGVSKANRGKYLAFTEKGTTVNGEGQLPTCVDYLKELGVKYVHINPFYDYASVNEAGSDTQFNWGYDPKNYNVPEGSYSSNPYDGNVRINEVKQMVMALHEAGIGVIMDVVYNHTYEGSTSFFNKTVPNYYYRLDSAGLWMSNSGCGNDTASERAMFRKYMIDSVTYWAEEYHIDGFRFDLMGLHDVETMNQLRTALDEINPDLITYGEGWSMSGGNYNFPAMANQTSASIMDTRISFFNDQFRDGMKGSVFESTGTGFLQVPNTSNMSSVLTGIRANVGSGNWKAQNPEQTVTYVDCHDNHTLYDRLVASTRGESTELYATRYEDLVAMNKMAAAVVYTSQGVPFILAGEEFARTKYGDHNSYMSSPAINKLDWNRTVDYADLVSYYKGLIQLREAYAPFRDATGDVVKNKMSAISPGKLPTGVLAYTINDDTAIWKNVAVMFNSSDAEQTITLTGNNLPQDWVILVDADQAGINSLGEINTGATITIPANTSYVLADKESYVASGVSTETGKVTIKHINQKTGEIIKEMVVTGDYGDSYVSRVDDSLAIDYDLVSAPENANGVFTEQDQVVEYYYQPYSLGASDISGDGVVTLYDAILLQKYVSKMITLTDEQLANADVNFDGEVNMLDALLVQKVVLKITVNGIGTVTVKYVDSDTEKEIAKAVTTRNRAGIDYTTEAADIEMYTLDETKLPENANGVYTNGETVVTYYYNSSGITRQLHVKLQDGQTWIPYMYCWNTAGTQLLGGWPGSAMTDDDGDGWFDIQVVTSDGTFNWIVNDGAGSQTNDNMNANSDLWIVVNTSRPSKTATSVTAYKEKP